MADQDTDLDSTHKQNTRAQQPGGAAARGPQTDNPDGRFEPDAMVPPYEGRNDKTGRAEEADHKAFRADEYAPPPGEGREISDEERSGIDSAEMNPSGPHGVGKSYGQSGEELAKDSPEDWGETGTHGQSDRPYGKPGQPDGDDSVGAQKNRDPNSPVMPFGDQGG
ncbi:MAG: hypothetical protein JWR88_1255 [Pseudonocardia sp.]|nr:hypothetical protein [Pseudonocardia sp.]